MDAGYFITRDLIRVASKPPMLPFSWGLIGLLIFIALITNPGFWKALALFLLFLAIIGVICLFEADRGSAADSRDGRPTPGSAKRPRNTDTRT